MAELIRKLAELSPSLAEIRLKLAGSKGQGDPARAKKPETWPGIIIKKVIERGLAEILEELAEYIQLSAEICSKPAE